MLVSFLWSTPSQAEAPKPPPKDIMAQPLPAPSLTPQFCFSTVALRGQGEQLHNNLVLLTSFPRLSPPIPRLDRRQYNAEPQYTVQPSRCRLRPYFHIHTLPSPIQFKTNTSLIVSELQGPSPLPLVASEVRCPQLLCIGSYKSGSRRPRFRPKTSGE